MARPGQEQQIARAIEAIKKLGFIDAKWIKEDFTKYLKSRSFQRTRFQKTFGLRGYPTGLPQRLFKILYKRKINQPHQILQAVAGLRLKDKYADATIQYLYKSRLTVC